jgi:uncharacterized protein YjdB
VARIRVTASEAAIEVGATTSVTATALDNNDAVVPGIGFAWASNDVAVATITGTGASVIVTGHSEGQAQVTASAEGEAGNLAVAVTRAAVAAVGILPTAATLSVNQTAQFSAQLEDARGDVLSGRDVTWTTGDSAIATVGGDGLVRGIAPGATIVTAIIEGKSRSAPVTVSSVPVASVTVAPTSGSLVVGATLQLAATPRDAGGAALGGRVVTWNTANGSVATVSSAGLVTALGTGSVTITATSEGRSGSATVSVLSVSVASVMVAPASGSLMVGSTLQLTATPRDAGGSPLTGRVITWSTASGSIATVSSTGLVTAQGTGTTTITATSEGRSGNAAITVLNVPVASVTVAPATASVVVGATLQLTATPRDAGGSALSGRTITWTTSTTSVATVSSSGLVTAQGAGSVTISATSEGRSGSAAITVTEAGGGSNFALQFYANVLNGQGRVSIPLDAPARPVDVGATDFTIEFWLRGRAADNTEGAVPCGLSTDAWIEGNIVLDRDRFTQPRDYGLALLNGRVAFGIRTASDVAYTLCGTTSVLDDQWHHIAVTRRITGDLALFLDGQLEASATGPAGDLSYPDGAGSGPDPTLVLAAEKWDVGAQYPGFRGQLDELRLSTTVRYTSAFTRPSRRFTPDAQTAALYHFDEGQGTTLGDGSNAPGGPSPGTLQVGGSPAGPAWIVSSAPTGP